MIDSPTQPLAFVLSARVGAHSAACLRSQGAMVTEPDVVYRVHPAVPSGAVPADGPVCLRCEHSARVHVDSSPFTPWCRLCYAHPFLHVARNHMFESAPNDR
jgi:hypothetical protein